MTKIFAFIYAVALLAMLVLSFTGLVPTYSEGERVGVVDKISRKGLWNKSYEGELKMQGVSVNAGGNLAQNTFHFSVLDPKVAEQITLAAKLAKPVQLRYKQWLINPSFKQSTKYTVIAVK